MPEDSAKIYRPGFLGKGFLGSFGKSQLPDEKIIKSETSREIAQKNQFETRHSQYHQMVVQLLYASQISRIDTLP